MVTTLSRLVSNQTPDTKKAQSLNRYYFQTNFLKWRLLLMKLQDSKWLADTLGLSLSTIEKLRSEQPNELPQPIIINKSIRYSEIHVDWWLQKQLEPNLPAFEIWLKEYYGQQKITLKVPKQTNTKETT